MRPPQRPDLSGSVALVTGGAGGLGAGMAGWLAARGARVVVADVDGSGARAVAEQVGGLAVRCDVRSAGDNRAAVEAAVTEYGGLHIVVLNAGVSSGGPLEDLDLESYRRAVDVNLDGVVLGLRAALPAMAARGGGRVVVTSSLAALAPVPLDPVYAATKAAVVHLVRSVGPSYAARGVLVNALCPGFADTPIVDPLRDLLAAGGIPIMPVQEVIEGFAAVLASEASGEAWLLQHGHPAQPYRFGGVPAPRPSPPG